MLSSDAGECDRRKKNVCIVSNKTANWMFTWNKCSNPNKKESTLCPGKSDGGKKEHSISKTANKSDWRFYSQYISSCCSKLNSTLFIRCRMKNFSLRPMTMILLSGFLLVLVLLAKFIDIRMMYFVGIASFNYKSNGSLFSRRTRKPFNNSMTKRYAN